MKLESLSENRMETKAGSSEILLYQTEDGKSRIEVRLEHGSVWVTQHQMAELFQTDRSSISKHINNILQEFELIENETCAIFAQVRKEGSKSVSRQVKHYNLDMIISVGYRVRSHRGTQFRQWATERVPKLLRIGNVQKKKFGNHLMPSKCTPGNKLPVY